MKFKVNGKEMKEKIESVLLKGKWNYGTNNKQNTLSSSIIIGVDAKEMKCSIWNADPATFVENKIALEEYENTSEGRFAIDTDILLKYLSNEVCLFRLEDNGLIISTDKKSVKLPILERHQYNDNIIHSVSNITMSRNMEEPVVISSKTSLTTRLKVATADLVEAFKECEVVGNSVYKISYDTNTELRISSTKGSESVEFDIEPMESVGDDAIVEFSAPFYKYLKAGITIISYNDESPISVINGDYKILRAPRIEG
jgi:hypothetical protein